MTRANPRAVIACLIAIAAPSAADPDTVRPAPACTPAQQERWTRVHAHQLDVDVRTLGSDILASAGARKHFTGVDELVRANWIPASHQRTTLCGRLHEAERYSAYYPGLVADHDANLYIIPDAPFAYLIDSIARVNDTSEWHRCQRPKSEPSNCMEAEIQLPRDLSNDPRYPAGVGPVPPNGRSVCVYGPWVLEKLHGKRPEIHPAEMRWFRREAEPQSIVLVLAHDTSRRFDDPGDYVPRLPGNPSGFQPWSQPPRTGRFSIAFEKRPGTPLGGLLVRTEAAANLRAREVLRATDSDDGVEHRLIVDGAPMLVVREEAAPAADDTAIGFSDVCRAPDGAVRGYVTIDSAVGTADMQRGQGFHVLNVRPVAEVDPSVTVRLTSARLRLATPAATLAATVVVNGERRELELAGDGAVHSLAGPSFSLKPGTGGISIAVSAAPAPVAGRRRPRCIDPLDRQAPDDRRPRRPPRRDCDPDASVLAASEILRQVPAGFERRTLRAADAGNELEVTYEVANQPPPVFEVASKAAPAGAPAPTIVLRKRSLRRTAAGLVIDADLADATGRRQPIVGIPVSPAGPQAARAHKVATPAGELALELPDVGLVARIAAASRDAARSSTSWAALGAALGVPTFLTSTRLVRSGSIELAVRADYVGAHDGRPMGEDTSELAEELTRTLALGRAEQRALFGSSTPFSIAWTFTAREVATTAAVPVEVGGRGSPGSVRAVLGTGWAPDARVKVTFPAALDRPIELVATATIKDALGHETRTTLQIASHALAPVDPRSPLPAWRSELARLASIPPAVLDDAAPPPDDAGVAALRTVARSDLADAVADGRLDVSELRRLLAVLKTTAVR